MHRTTRPTINCTCPCGCMNPPMLVNDAKSSPSRVAIAGMIVWYGRFPGANTFGWAGSREKLAPSESMGVFDGERETMYWREGGR